MKEREHQSLPIDRVREALTDALAQHELLVVTAPTGSGKSTRLPLWLAEHTGGPILVVEPRRVACRALAEYLARQHKTKVGEHIGYRVRFEARTSPKTQIEFVTPGVALRLLHDPKSSRYTGILIDEFHERGWEIDLLVTLLRCSASQLQRPLALETKQLPLILTSATIAGTKLAAQIGAHLLESTGRSYPVTISYLDAPSQPSIRSLEERVVEAIQTLLPEDDGDILVFLPGKGEIEACRARLQQLALPPHVEIVPVHASLPMQRLARALAASFQTRRIYLATNVAETSLTLPGVTAVVDAGLARTRIHRGGRSALALVPIPLSLMDQRSGRAGRLAPGRCIRLWKQSYRPKPETQPEIERIELDDLLLQAGSYGLEGAHFLDAPWLSPPPSFAVEEARTRLQHIGALDAQYRLTRRGHDLAHWPVSAQEASLLVDAPTPLQATLADIVALLQSPTDLLLPPHAIGTGQRTIVQEERAALLSKCQNEVYTQLTLLRQGHIQHHGMHPSSTRQARAIASQLRQKMGCRENQPQTDESPLPAPETLARWLLTCIPQAGFVLRKRAQKTQKKSKKRKKPQHERHPWTNGEFELEVETFIPLDPEQEIPKPTAGVILSHSWIGEQGLRIRGRGRMLLPCSLRLLAEAQLGEASIEAPTLTYREDKTPTIEACITRKLAGITLESEQKPLQGLALRQATTTLLLKGSLFPGYTELLLDDLHLLTLLSRWPKPRSWEPAEQAQAWQNEPSTYVMERLQSLGLEDSTDLQLLEKEDLRPDIVELCGIDPYELERYAKDFPRIWRHQGATYQCTFSPRSRKALLEPLNKNARKAPDPNPRVLPLFQGFRVEYRCDSRQITIRP